MGSSIKTKERRKSLFKKQNGKCHYCQCDMIHMFTVPPKMKRPDNLCTIEHLRDRFDPRRQEPNHHHEQRWVAACNKCNHEQNKKREREQGIEELRRRARKGEQRNKLHSHNNDAHMSSGGHVNSLCYDKPSD